MHACASCLFCMRACVRALCGAAGSPKTATVILGATNPVSVQGNQYFRAKQQMNDMIAKLTLA